MVGPYKMVLVNLIGSVVLIIGILIYRFIYPKKKINLFILLLFISILPILSIFRKGDYQSGDFNIHIYRIMSFYDSLKEGHFLPSWAAELNASYGNPLFIFNYPLPYYIISIFHFIGLSFISSMKIYLGLNLYLSGIFMYLWIKRLTKSTLAAFTSAIFFIFNPYHLIDIHFRATPGESTIFTIAPLLFYFITRYFQEKKFFLVCSLSLLTGLIFLAHPLLSGPVLGIIILYILLIGITQKKIKSTIVLFIALLGGIIASQYTWLSFFIYTKYTYHIASVAKVHSNEYLPFLNLFYAPWRFGLLFQGHYGELALFLGYTQILVILGTGIFIVKNAIPKKIIQPYLFWFLMVLFFIFLMHPISIFIWKYFPMFFYMFIPFGRLLLPTAICTSALAGYFVLAFTISNKRIYLIYILIVLTIGTTILNWGQRTVLPNITDTELQQGIWKSTITEGKTAYFLNNKWADVNHFWFKSLPKQHLNIMQGKGFVKQITRTSVEHTYVLDAKTPVTIRENTLYFPGWSLESNNKTISIYPGKRGIIYAKLPQGLQYVKLSYSDFPPYKISKIIGEVSFIIIFILLIISLLPIRLVKK